MNLYVLQFLSAHKDEQGYPRSVGNEKPWYCHQTKSCKIHLFVKASGEGNLPPKNVAKSTFTILKSTFTIFNSFHLQSIIPNSCFFLQKFQDPDVEGGNLDSPKAIQQSNT